MLKALLSLGLFIEVIFFSQLPYRFSKISTSTLVMEIFEGLSTGLFLGIAFFHMIPQANHKLQGLFSGDDHQHEHNHHQQGGHHSHDVPIGSLISLLSFLFIFTLETYFHDEEGHHMHEHAHSHVHSHHSSEALSSPSKQKQDKYFDQPVKSQGTLQTNKQNNGSKSNKISIQLILTQLALSLHSFFECLSIGIQQNQNFVITLAIAICFHKWAEALTLGYSYYKAQISQIQALKYALFFALLNSSAILIGWAISVTSNTMAGIFNGIAGGTFLYVSFIEKIAKNFTEKQTILKKVGLTLMGIVFAIMIG